MIISVWRYSHLTLAISSFLLLTIASVTGIFLAFEPVIEKSRDYKAASFDTLTLAQTVPLLKEKFPGIQEVSVDDHQFVLVKYAAEEGGDQQVYVDPATGKVLGIPTEKLPLFQWMTTLHRSLFIHETGRILMGITAFLLILIAVSGIFLVVQRQNGWKNFFSNVEKTGFAQYYHVVFGRISLFFILAIALTGTYMAVYRFMPTPGKASALIDESQIKEEPLKELSEFTVLQQTPLSSLQKLQYPFSDFPEDYYNVQLKGRELCINQFTGDILAQQNYTKTYQLANFSLRWHTGRWGTIWALLMALASAYILFFIYSGFAITLKRRRGRSKNKFKAKDARILILVGSENGGTFKFADAIYTQLIRHGEKVFITDLSNFTAFPNAEQLVIMTSTYGQGDAPSNAKRLADRIRQYPQGQTIQYSIVGFGSRSYSRFCQFAFDIEKLLQKTSWANPVLPVYTVNDKSPQDFSGWMTEWTHKTGFSMLMPRELLEPDTADLKKLSVTSRTNPDEEASFIIQFKSSQLRHAVSGDLLAIYPRNDHRERLYSIGKVDKNIQLSVKLHEHGLGSSFLNHLQQGDIIKAKLVKNQHFRFPKKTKKVIMVSNGTGIAPFLGMITENRRKIPIELYCGFRNRSSFTLYEPFLNKQLSKGNLASLSLVLSREEEKEYVSHRLLKNSDAILQCLKNGGVIMLCGSLSMQNDVMKVLEDICSVEDPMRLPELVAQGKILTDCY
ncbi:PepSY domain-containing protein [Niabella yanshanensis]|uniref:NADPH--hemoprotein reductase n=1 Tax=Niabella yanshanensis TaxID=577386 RepID=A0ABZ0W2Y1_9BACT|nr:PepSY domain-containing protein [Niabella yanshanensis]WQD36988.1 PepSY domain-containing protein [Niabella yanshanensis]